MSDPAVEAAQRAARDMRQHDVYATRLGDAERGAREALKPIRELLDRYHNEAVHRSEVWQLMDEIAPLVYTTEEL